MSAKLLGLCLLSASLLGAAAPARANQDQVQFLHNINVGPGESVHDAVCIFCGVHVEGEVDGDLVVIFGNVRLHGQAHHDVVAIFGSVTAAGDSSIGGDLVSVFGSVHLGDNVSVGKDMVTIFGVQHVPRSASVGKDRVSISPWIFFGPLLIVLFALILIVHEVQAHRRRQFFPNYPLPPRQ